MKRWFAGLSFSILAVASAQAADFVVAITGANVPFEFVDDKQNVIGFEVDLVKAAARRMGKSVEFTQIPFNALFAAVQSGRADIAVSSITITPKRLESVAFSQPYFDSDLCLVTQQKSDVANVAALKGKVLAVVTGSTPEIWASANEKKIGFSEIRRFDGIGEPIMALGSRRVDGAVQDCPMVAHYLKDKPQFKIADKIATSEQYGAMGAPKNAWLAKFNDELSAMKREGEMARLYKRWFEAYGEPTGSTVTVLPPPAR